MKKNIILFKLKEKHTCKSFLYNYGHKSSKLFCKVQKGAALKRIMHANKKNIKYIEFCMKISFIIIFLNNISTS